MVAVGRIVGEFGLKGAVKVEVATDFPERFDPGSTLILDGVPRKVERTTWHRGQARIKLEGIDSVEAARALKWKELLVDATDRPELEEDEFYTLDLIGLEVFDEQGRRLGLVDDVIACPAHDVIQMGDTLIPARQEFVRGIDLDQGRITVRLIPGMLEEGADVP